MHKKQGIGIFGVIVIIAVIAVGGYATVKYTQNTKMSVDEKTMENSDLSYTEIESTVSANLSDLQSTLNSNLEVDAKIAAATDIINRIKTTISENYDKLEVEAQAKVDVLNQKITELESQLEADIEASSETVADLIVEYSDDNSMMEDDNTIEQDDLVTDDESRGNEETMNENESMEENSEDNSVGAEVEVEAGAELQTQ